MKKLLPIFLLLTACEIPCTIGDTAWCYCEGRKFITECTMEGHFNPCGCEYLNDNSLIFWFPECNDTIDTCLPGEIQIPCTTTCWRMCPTGTEYTQGACVRQPAKNRYYQSEDSCRIYDSRYRLPTVTEIGQLLQHCNTSTFSHEFTNYCASYYDSALKHVLAPTIDPSLKFWVLSNAPGHAWRVKIYTNDYLATEFQWSDTATKKAASVCVRDW